MVVEIGHFALILAFVVSIFQVVVPLVGVEYGRVVWMEVVRPAALCQFLLVFVAFFSLVYAYVFSDFSVVNVVENSHADKPLLYKISGVWGNHEGSILLWVLILALFGALFAVQRQGVRLGLFVRILSVQGLLSVGFLGFILWTSNPFLRIFPPALSGNDLNPLLQDPALALHPPFLYLGYVGFSLVFSFTIAALLEGRIDASWARWVRPWLLVTWMFQTLGIVFGSWWAYYTLGWGGWWFWDPVENASLMPWLAATALLHSVIVVERRGALKSWCVFLSILTFALSLIGTFIVRSGILTSVHAFALDPARGVFILGLLIFFIGGAFLVYLLRAPTLHDEGLFTPLSREGAIIFNNLILGTATGIVFIGTLYPLFLDVLGAGRVTVGPPYFHATFLPVMVPLALAMAVAPCLHWKHHDLYALLPRCRVVFFWTTLGLLLVLGLRFDLSLLALGGIGLGLWVIVGVLVEYAEQTRCFSLPLRESLLRAQRLSGTLWGMMLAHLGIGVLILGITGSSLWKIEKTIALDLQKPTSIIGYELVLESVQTLQGPNYVSQQAILHFWQDQQYITTLYPERRTFDVSGTEIRQASIYSHAFFDIMAILGVQNRQQQWTIQIYYNPLIACLWLGSGLMALGALVSLLKYSTRKKTYASVSVTQ